jgi:dolichol-phosphate mannosyltransferase
MSYGSSFLLRMLFPIENVRDYTCGYRAYSFNFMQKLVDTYSENLFTQQGFACMVDILLKTRVLKPRIKEVAMILRYDQKQGASKMKVFRTIYQTLKLIGINKFNRK